GIGETNFGDSFHMQPIVVDWTLASSSASLDQPDKRQFGALWQPSANNPGVPPFVPPFTTPDRWFPLFPGENINLGNFQRIWKTIEEESEQYTLNVKWPFEQWNGRTGYFKAGLFGDSVDRDFDQNTFSNFGDAGSVFPGGFDQPWSQ